MLSLLHHSTISKASKNIILIPLSPKMPREGSHCLRDDINVNITNYTKRFTLVFPYRCNRSFSIRGASIENPPTLVTILIGPSELKYLPNIFVCSITFFIFIMESER